MMRIRYNAPVTLTFALLATTVLLFDTVTRSNLTLLLFTALPRGNFDFARPLAYVRLISHIVGHLGWEHLLSNFAIILLIGPILEEKHGSLRLLWMIFFTALVTGLVNTLFFHTALLGASSIVFMMIILVSFTNVRNGDIPLTFILVVILYLCKRDYPYHRRRRCIPDSPYSRWYLRFPFRFRRGKKRKNRSRTRDRIAVRPFCPGSKNNSLLPSSRNRMNLLFYTCEG